MSWAGGMMGSTAGGTAASGAMSTAAQDAIKLEMMKKAGNMMNGQQQQSSIPSSGMTEVMTPQGGWYIGDSTRYTSARG